MRITFIGTGNVGAPLADHLQRAGHQVTLAARDPNSDAVRAAQARNPAMAAVPLDEAVRAADVGGLDQALHLEHMTLLWVRMVRADGHSPHLVWAALRR